MTYVLRAGCYVRGCQGARVQTCHVPECQATCQGLPRCDGARKGGIITTQRGGRNEASDAHGGGIADYFSGGPGAGLSGFGASGNAAVDAVFEPFTRPGSPGCAVGVYKDGRIEYERGYGLASLEHDLPITPASVFYLGSVSKQFTAFAAALAIQEGRTSADDPIRKYLPELPAYARRSPSGT